MRASWLIRELIENIFYLSNDDTAKRRENRK